MVNNILIIGNGFDLVHGFPPRYTDFHLLVRNCSTFYDALLSLNGKGIIASVNDK